MRYLLVVAMLAGLGCAARQKRQQENALYAQCRAFVLDVDASSKDPQRARACMDAMVVLDHERQRRDTDLASIQPVKVRVEK